MNVNETTNEDLQVIINTSNSLSSILRGLGVSETCPHNRFLLKSRMSLMDLTTYNTNKTVKSPYSNIKEYVKCDDDYFCLGTSRRSGTHLRKRLLKYKGWKDECSICKSLPIWMGLPLSLHVDHINGNPFDNTITNLRFLCPNCHSQTETFGKKNSKK